MEESREFKLTLRLEDSYRFEVDFEEAGLQPIFADEPPPLGSGSAPNAARLLGAAIGNCLAASLVFCLERSRVEVHGMRVRVAGTIVRNERGRYRIADVRVRLHPDVAETDLARLGRCADVFEDFCIVTQSVRDGLEVDVAVELPAATAR
jgi:uncharacterized OsmC-like protein